LPARSWAGGGHRVEWVNIRFGASPPIVERNSVLRPAQTAKSKGSGLFDAAPKGDLR